MLESTKNKKTVKVAIVASGAVGAYGGAERHFQGLLNGLIEIGCIAELLFIPAEEPSFQAILDNHYRCSKLNLNDYDIVISTKAPTYAVSHHAHVMYLIHTVRIFDDMFDEQFPKASLENYKQRAELHSLELTALTNIKARFSNGKETADRLYRWRGLKADVLHPPLLVNNFKRGDFGDYFFIPGRLHKWKRVELSIMAVLLSRYPIKLKIAGIGEYEDELRKIAGDDRRIEFLGKIDEDELISLYSDALAVPFFPLREDFGYITIEAFSSGKPVITCTDSGEPSRLVRNGSNGFIVPPDPHIIKEIFERLYLDKNLSKSIGDEAYKSSRKFPTWPEVAEKIITAALDKNIYSYNKKIKISVLDMQPIDPAVGGGRLRLFGLYHNLGAASDCTYVGTYDWRGMPYRSHKLSPTLLEIDIPLSDAHHDASEELKLKTGGLGVIDLAFSKQAYLSPDFIHGAKETIYDADVVVFSHPWVYSLVKNSISLNQVVVYDSHNVEGYLRAQLLNKNNDLENDLLRQVIQDEKDLGWDSDWILTCSHEDLLRFNRVYGFPIEKMRVVPNGVMAFRDPLPTDELKSKSRNSLGIKESLFLAIFIGSPYGPNREAANFIINELAPIMPDVTFVIAGGVGNDININQENVLITRSINEDIKTLWLYSSDIAVNPMMSGSGTNIKMFDFMAMSLPVVTTNIGARGIETAGCNSMMIVNPDADSFRNAINELMSIDVRLAMGTEARLCVENSYSWERISDLLGIFLNTRKLTHRQSKPKFSVVIPTYERQHQIDKLMIFLQKQVERDFEVIVIDQSSKSWGNYDKHYGFPLIYYHSPVKGAVRARNTGAMLSQGEIVVFVDDDCLPEFDWLINARAYFDDPMIVGIEGLIDSDHFNDVNWRPVTNIGFEGIGFMTANLLVRSSKFQFLGGFDLQFDHPHFREDTDFGWRLQELGNVPYASDVKVFHPAQSRNLERESLNSRNKYFEKDALLYKKHPIKYEELFFREAHYLNTKGFLENLILGFKKYNVEMPGWLELLTK
jgi:glycosyltransferase involved in cell wall biosynthesis